MKLLWYVSGNKQFEKGLPRWAGPVWFDLERDRILVAAVPLNLVLAFWNWLIVGLRWRWAPQPERDRLLNAAEQRGYERGFRVGADAQRRVHRATYLRENS